MLGELIANSSLTPPLWGGWVGFKLKVSKGCLKEIKVVMWLIKITKAQNTLAITKFIITNNKMSSS